MTYEATEKILFAADGFGKFGALDAEEEWADEARRYYIGIVGKYGPQVQACIPDPVWFRTLLCEQPSHRYGHPRIL